jgi:hypothetical protein
LAESEEAREELEELRETMGLVGDAFASAPDPARLGSERETRVEFGVRQGGAGSDRISTAAALAIGLSAAASLVVVFALSWQMTDLWHKTPASEKPAQAPSEVARLEEQAPPGPRG